MTNADRAEAFTEEHEITGLVHLLTSELDAATQAAEERMREKCAKVADAFADGIEQADSFYADRVCELLAAAIRAIKVGEK